MFKNKLFQLPLVSLFIFSLLVLSFQEANATAQWSRKYGISCTACHSIFPRLNSFGDEFLKNGYQMESTYKKNWEEAYPIDAGGVKLDEVSNLFGFRLSITPFKLETYALQKDLASEKGTRITLGSVNWAQFFVAGPIYKDFSFFTELEMGSSAYKMAWFYFNWTNITGSKAVNLQFGRITPMEYTSYPNRLPTLPELKAEVMLKKSSNGAGEESVDISSTRPGVQYYGTFADQLTVYAGTSPGASATDINQFLHFWAGAVYKIPESAIKGFGGSSVTLHYYGGKDTKGTGTATQIENSFTRIVPQFNVRWNDKLDLQFTYVIAKDDNWTLASTAKEFNYSGIGIEAGYFLNPTWMLGLHYDKVSSDDLNNDGKDDLDYQRVVPSATYIVNENIRTTAYYAVDLKEQPTGSKANNQLWVNIRIMY